MKRLSIEFIKNEFKKEGYILCDDVYINAHSYLNVVCPNGHRWKISWSHWKRGRRCKYCNRTIYFDDIKKEIENEGYKVISDKYINDKVKLKMICPKGHYISVSADGSTSAYYGSAI